MGVLRSHPVGHLQKTYGLRHFVETGTWRGDGLLTALRYPFTTLWSVEASLDLMNAAADRITKAMPGDSRWEIIHGDSVLVIPMVASRMAVIVRQPILWWLDAHLPERYDTEGVRLPLEDELRSIVEVGGHQRDVFIMDDWRLYEHHPYVNGRWPEAPPGNAAAVRKLLSPTHDLVIDTRAEGALLAVPQ